MKYVYVLVAICMAWMSTLSYGQGVCCSSPKPHIQDYCPIPVRDQYPSQFTNCDGSSQSAAYSNYTNTVNGFWDAYDSDFRALVSCVGGGCCGSCHWDIPTYALNQYCETLRLIEANAWADYLRVLIEHCDIVTPTPP